MKKVCYNNVFNKILFSQPKLFCKLWTIAGLFSSLTSIIIMTYFVAPTGSTEINLGNNITEFNLKVLTSREICIYAFITVYVLREHKKIINDCDCAYVCPNVVSSRIAISCFNCGRATLPRGHSNDNKVLTSK